MPQQQKEKQLRTHAADTAVRRPKNQLRKPVHQAAALPNTAGASQTFVRDDPGAASRACGNSATRTRTRVARVRAEYPNQLEYSGAKRLGAKATREPPATSNAPATNLRLAGATPHLSVRTSAHTRTQNRAGRSTAQTSTSEFAIALLVSCASRPPVVTLGLPAGVCARGRCWCGAAVSQSTLFSVSALRAGLANGPTWA